MIKRASGPNTQAQNAEHQLMTDETKKIQAVEVAELKDEPHERVDEV